MQAVVPASAPGGWQLRGHEAIEAVEVQTPNLEEIFIAYMQGNGDCPNFRGHGDDDGQRGIRTVPVGNTSPAASLHEFIWILLASIDLAATAAMAGPSLHWPC